MSQEQPTGGSPEPRSDATAPVPPPAPEPTAPAYNTEPPLPATGAAPAYPTEPPPPPPAYDPATPGQAGYPQTAYPQTGYTQAGYPQAGYPPAGPGTAVATGAQPMTPEQERTGGLAAHGITLAATVLSGGFLGFVCALVLYLVFRDKGPFVRSHSANALNVQIITGIVLIVSIPLMFVLVGFATYAAAWLFAVIVHIIGMVKANNGEWWDPPLTPKFVK
jgi:uncharacterized Tic20 family protein